MKANTRKYSNILDAQTKIYNKLKKLTCSGNNWQKEREQTIKLEQKLNEYENKLNNLSSLITQEEFELHLSDRMCLSWEDFNSF